MKALAIGGTVFLVGVAGAAPAQEGGMTGYLEFEAIATPGDDDWVLAGDISYNVAPGRLGFGGLGLDTAARVLWFDSEINGAVYIAPTFGLGPDGKIGVGIVRPAYATFFKGPAIGGIREFQALVDIGLGSIPETVYMFEDTGAPVGVRYDGRYGALSVATSLSHFTGEEFTAFDATAEYRLGQAAVQGAIELVDGSGTTGSTYVLGATAGTGIVSGGAYIIRREFDGDSQDGARGFVTVAPNDRLSVSATAIGVEDGEDLYGLSMEYSPTGIGYGQIGATAIDGELYYDLSVGLKF